MSKTYKVWVNVSIERNDTKEAGTDKEYQDVYEHEVFSAGEFKSLKAAKEKCAELEMQIDPYTQAEV